MFWVAQRRRVTRYDEAQGATTDRRFVAVGRSGGVWLMGDTVTSHIVPGGSVARVVAVRIVMRLMRWRR